MDNNKKVILINGTNSNWYEQVIFILKPNKENKVPINLVNEAEKIINEYMALKYSDKNKYINPFEYKNNKDNKNIKNVKNNSVKKINKSLFNYILNISIFCCIILIGVLLYKIGF